MFIEISKDVAEYLRENQKADDNIRIAIETLFICMLKKKHIVFADRQAVQCLLKANMSLSATCALKWIEKSYYDLYALKNKIGRRILLIMGESYFDGYVYYLDINDCEEFSGSKMLSENDSDFQFYMDIYKFFMPAHNFHAIYFDNESFYGGNIEGKLTQSLSKHDFLLCIVDSDKEYPAAAHGNTAKKAIEILKNRTFPPHNLYILPVREKENLFPFSQYLSCCPDQKQWLSIILEEDNEDIFKFIKVKEGIKQKRVNAAEPIWMAFYGKLLEKCKKAGICCVQQDENKYYISGINSKALEKTSGLFFADNNYKTLQNSTKIEKFFGRQIFIIDTWKEIARLLFDFGCCLSKNVNFIA